MKFLALYLPQFHAIPENDKWWGKGFTEWTNVRKAKPLFRGHHQPRVPAGDNYYDLASIAPMIEHAKLARKHGIHGFCYYHYWFNGKRLLEQPLEKMLATPEVDIPFCLSWANEPWTRAWDGAQRDVLIAQEYGAEPDWRRHFECLVRFFRDPRYIRVGNRPMLLIYRTSKIHNADAMLSVWNSMAREAGFDGIYLVETMNSFQKIPKVAESSAVVEFEPMYSLTHHFSRRSRLFARLWGILRYGGINTKNYRRVWQEVARRKYVDYGGREVFPCAFVDWDNSARMGKAGLVLRNANPATFERYLGEMLAGSKLNPDTGFVFVNAWNEWAEGAYLEPDTQHGTAYLDVIARAVAASGGRAP